MNSWEQSIIGRHTRDSSLFDSMQSILRRRRRRLVLFVSRLIEETDCSSTRSSMPVYIFKSTHSYQTAIEKRSKHLPVINGLRWNRSSASSFVRKKRLNSHVGEANRDRERPGFPTVAVEMRHDRFWTRSPSGNEGTDRDATLSFSMRRTMCLFSSSSSSPKQTGWEEVWYSLFDWFFLLFPPINRKRLNQFSSRLKNSDPVILALSNSPLSSILLSFTPRVIRSLLVLLK